MTVPPFGEGSVGKPAGAAGAAQDGQVGVGGRVMAPSLRRGKIGLYGASSPNEKPAPPISRVGAQPATLTRSTAASGR